MINLKSQSDVLLSKLMQLIKNQNMHCPPTQLKFHSEGDWQPLKGGIFASQEFTDAQQLVPPWEKCVVQGELRSNNEQRKQAIVFGKYIRTTEPAERLDSRCRHMMRSLSAAVPTWSSETF